MTTAHPIPTLTTATTSPHAPHVEFSQLRARPVAPSWHGFWLLTWFSFWKLLTNPFSLGFALALPIFMYLMFGANQDYGTLPVAHGNVAATVLVNMAIYGSIMTSSSMGADVSLERTSGVTRLFALTPMSSLGIISARIVASMGITMVVVGSAYTVGHLTGAQMAGEAWPLTAGLIIVLSVLPAALGLATGFAVRTDGAFAATSLITVLGAFGSGMFIPLDQMGGFFERIAPWTPFNGIVNLVQMPLVGWETFQWSWIGNVAGWVLLFTAVAVSAQRRNTGR